MASYEKRPGGYLARVRKGGITKSAVFKRKSDATAWATKLEADIENGKTGGVLDKTFGELIAEYIRLHSSNLDGSRQENFRLRRVLTYPIAQTRLSDLSAVQVAAWRDTRLKEVSSESVRREWSRLSHACEIAIKEWKWMRENPFREVKIPEKANPRTRIISADEIDRLLVACGYEYDAPPVTRQAKVGAVLLFALETAMRAGEICALTWNDYDVPRRIMKVTALMEGARKTRSAREVPLSVAALRLIEQVRGQSEARIFDIGTASLDVLFRKAKARALIDDIHFHDSRATALTRLASKIEALPLARISGHKDLRILLNTYYRQDMSELVDKIG
jgi:integrase